MERVPIWTECPPTCDSQRSSQEHVFSPQIPQHAFHDMSNPRHSMTYTRGLLTPRHGTLAPRCSGGSHTDIEPGSCKVGWGLVSFRVGWEDEPMQAVEATGPHNLYLGTTIPKASHRLWALGSEAYGGRSPPTSAMMLSANGACSVSWPSFGTGLPGRVGQDTSRDLLTHQGLGHHFVVVLQSLSCV